MSTKREIKKYPQDYKVKAVELAKEIGQSKAAMELGVPVGTLHGWITAAQKGELDMGVGKQNPETGLTLVEELKQLRAEMKNQAKIIALLRKENAFLEEASAFFAASRQRLTREKD
jgi:transposase